MTAVVTRSTGATAKGSPLTTAELDQNFINLNDKKVEQTSSTGGAYIPSGTTAERPASPSGPLLRYNSTLVKFECFHNGSWIALQDASSIAVADAGNYYTGSNVEAVLQEIGVQMGDIATALNTINGEVI